MEVGGRKEVSHPLSPTHRHITPAADNQWASSTQPQQTITFSIKAKFGLISIARIVFSTSNSHLACSHCFLTRHRTGRKRSLFEQFGAKVGRFWAKNQFLGGSKTFGTLLSGNQ